MMVKETVLVAPVSKTASSPPRTCSVPIVSEPASPNTTASTPSTSAAVRTGRPARPGNSDLRGVEMSEGCPFLNVK